MKKSDYRKYRLNKLVGLTKYCFTLLVLLGLIIWAPNQAAQFTGYIGAFILGRSKAKSALGL